ncbi:MAG: DUF4278 domain-containing protein [Nodosilinea sp.]
MKLIYRGISYDATPHPAPKLSQTGNMGHYRGVPVVLKNLAELPAQPAVNLAWRGVPYRAGITAPVAAAPIEIPAVAASLATSAVAAETVSTSSPMTADSSTTTSSPMTTDLPTTTRTPSPTSISDLARNLFIRRHQRSRRREQGMMVRLAAEVGIPIADAAHYESHIQGKMPHDFSGYDRGSAAMS